MKTLIASISFSLLTACGGGGGASTSASQPAAPITAPAATAPIATVALTFDYYGSTYSSAYPMMKARGLVGTFFIAPEMIDNGQSTTEQLKEMAANGWEIGAYSNVNMPDLLAASGANAALAKLNQIKATMAAKGFTANSLAPTSRAWNPLLRDLSAGIFGAVRANVVTTEWQSYPIPDPLYVAKGATASLSSADTAESLAAQLKSVQANNGLWVIVVHKVGDDADPIYSIKSEVMAAFLDKLAQEKAAGRVRVTTFEKSIH